MIVAISGKQRRGKNIVAAIICKYLNLIYPNQITTEFSSAYEVKLQLAINLNTTIFQIIENKEELRGKLIDLAESEKDRLGGDCWIKHLEYLESDNIVISDLRFKDEIKYLKNRNDVIYIRVNRDLIHLEKFKLSNENHYSETDLDDFTEWNYILDNNGTIEELEIKIIKMLRNILC